MCDQGFSIFTREMHLNSNCPVNKILPDMVILKCKLFQHQVFHAMEGNTWHGLKYQCQQWPEQRPWNVEVKIFHLYYNGRYSMLWKRTETSSLYRNRYQCQQLQEQRLWNVKVNIHFSMTMYGIPSIPWNTWRWNLNLKDWYSLG